MSSNEQKKPASYATRSSEMTRETIYQNESSSETAIRIIHFNDVYNIEPSTTEPQAGAARFLTAVNLVKQDGPCLVFFSGDAFSPSTIGLVLKGQQMLPILNKLDINAACIGNHDFDFGVDVLVDLISKTNFPWLMSNFYDIHTGKPLALAHSKQIVNFNGYKIGIVGLVEKEWIDTLNQVDTNDVSYRSFVDVGRELASELKTVDNCDYVIALTHMRVPNDKKLAEEVADIDLILGGHDHHYHTEIVNKKWLMKSGTDFKDFSLINISKKNPSDELKVCSIERYIVDSKVKENDEIKEATKDFLSQGEKGLDVVLGNMNADLDGRFVTVRSMESNIGSYICDLIMLSVSADCVIINSGTLRSDCITPAGEFTVGDLKKIIPYPDQIVVLLCNGKCLHEALENSVSQYPKLEGRFPQVAGIQFKFDPSKPAGERIDPNYIYISGEPINFEKDYKLACKGYMKDGRDGFQMLPKCQVLISEEDGPLLFTIVENHFKKFRKLQEMSHQTDINSNSIPVSNNKSGSPYESKKKCSLQKSQSDSSFMISHPAIYANPAKSNTYLKRRAELEMNLLKFEPKCDGRICI